MPYTRPRPTEIEFPLSGVDQSLTVRRQPQLTTYNLLNVRAFPPSSDRLGGGSREGLSKLFDDDNQVGVEGDRRVTGLDVLTEATNITDPNSFAQVALAEDWSGASTGNPTNLGTDWHPLVIEGSLGRVETHGLYSVNGSSQLLLDSGAGSGTGQFLTMMSSFFVSNSIGVSVVVAGDRQCVTSNDGYGGGAGGPNNVGPIVGADNTIQTGIFACLVATGTNTVQARIYEFSATNLTQRATSGDLTLVGDGTATDYTIALSVDSSGEVTATFDATDALSGPTDLDVELTYTTALTGNRGGIGMFPRSSGSNQADIRTVSSCSLTKLVPPSNTIYSQVDPAIANPIDGNQFYLPTTFLGVSRTAAGVLTVTAGGPTSASDPDWPAIDDTDDTIIVTNPDGNNADYPDEINFALYNDLQAQYGVTCRIDPDEYGQNEDIASPVFRATTDGENALILQFNSSYTSTTGMAAVAAINAIALVDNVATDLGTLEITASNKELAWFHEDAEIRCTDDGTTIRIYANGILLKSFAPSSFPNWTSGIGTALENNIGCGFTGGLDPTSSSNSAAQFGKVEIVQGEVISPINVSNVKNKLAIFTPQTVEVGDTNTLVVTPQVGAVLSNPLPVSSSFNRKFYAVDGSGSIIINPATNVSTNWVSSITDGALPTGCRLVAFFRGSAYLAATDSDPSIWYKSRSLDPLDWDYGADPQVSTAVAGNNGEVGQPGDAITALIPFSDDYLVFGMARSLGVLEGDPGYGGQFQIASNEAGIVGPRAFTFDDRGNLYFIGAGGLYRMLRGGFNPEPVGPRKLRRVLEELDIDSNLIQVGFRPSDRTIRIYVTPTDGETLGTHIVYDTRTDGFFFDQIPLGHGPWALEQTNGVLDIDRNIILGGNDGFIRRPDDSATSDDGTAITSSVEIPIPQMESGTIETICQELQFVLGEGGGTISWYWFVGDSPEEVRQLTIGSEVASGTITGTGFKSPVGLRQTGAAHKLILTASSASERWALERVVAQMAVTTTRRR